MRHPRHASPPYFFEKIKCFQRDVWVTHIFTKGQIGMFYVRENVVNYRLEGGEVTDSAGPTPTHARAT